MKLYKAFAIITLVVAPIIVLITQSVTPQAPLPLAAPVMDPVTQAPDPVAAPVTAPQPMPAAIGGVPDPASFSQPLPDAGRPFLAPGAGLPGDPQPDASSPTPEDSAEPTTEG